MTEDTLHIHLDVVEMQIVACVLVCSEVHHPVGRQPPPPPAAAGTAAVHTARAVLSWPTTPPPYE